MYRTPRPWDCMLRVADCAATDRYCSDVAAGDNCGANTIETDQYRAKLLRLLASHWQHLTTADLALAGALKIMPILPRKTPIASDDHTRFEVVAIHRFVRERNAIATAVSQMRRTRSRGSDHP